MASSPKIVVAGDITIDWFALTVPPVDPGSRDGYPPNFELYTGTRMVAQPGGTLLLARFIQSATASSNVITHQLQNVSLIPPSETFRITEQSIFPSIIRIDKAPEIAPHRRATQFVEIDFCLKIYVFTTKTLRFAVHTRSCRFSFRAAECTNDKTECRKKVDHPHAIHS